MVADARRRIDIRAPQAGTVVGLDIFTVGGVVAPGQPILHIVPANDERVIDAEVRPEDIDKVAIGQAAVVRFPAFDRRTTPELTGAVTMVSADRLVDPQSGAAHYQARIRLAEEELAKLGGQALISGMPAETFIITGERTALSYLLKPFLDALARTAKAE